jgi:hypothetical protein
MQTKRNLITSTNSSEIKAITNIKGIISRANQSDPAETLIG